MERSASYEARYAPLPYPTNQVKYYFKSPVTLKELRLLHGIQMQPSSQLFTISQLPTTLLATAELRELGTPFVLCNSHT